MADKVLIFGGSGFVGSHVADALTDNGYEVLMYDLKPSLYVRENQKMIIGDILDEEKINKVTKGARFVYNFAGIADIHEASERPIETVKHNILGNTIILEACRKWEVERFVFASTVYVYSTSGSFYRVSKQANELMIEACHEKYGLDYTILRYGSLYGPRADLRNGIYRFLWQAIVNKKIDYYGSGEEVREYIHVWDAAKLSVEILKPEYKNQSFVLTGHQILRGRELLTMIQEMLPFKIEIEYHSAESPLHYKITPYNFTPKVGKKITTNIFIDMGQGLLQLIEEIYKGLGGRKTIDAKQFGSSNLR